MASRTRRAKVVLLSLGIALVALVALAWQPLYWLVTTEKRYMEWDYGQTRGWQRKDRWTDLIHLEERFRVSTGFKTLSWSNKSDLYVTTGWRMNGRLVGQWRIVGTGGNSMFEERTMPPWWGVTNQTEPSMPEWMKDDEKWAKALE